MSYIGVLVKVPASPLQIQLPANIHRKAAEDGPSSWDPNTHMGDQEEVLGSCLQFNPDLAVIATWVVNQWLSDIPFLSLSLSLSIKWINAFL